MSIRVELKTAKWQSENWKMELNGNELKLCDHLGRSVIYELGSVMFQDGFATYNLKGYCDFFGKAPADVLKRVKDVRLNFAGDGAPEVPIVSTTKFRWATINL